MTTATAKKAPTKKAPAKKTASSSGSSTTSSSSNSGKGQTPDKAVQGTTVKTEKSEESLKAQGDVSAPSDEGTTGNPNAAAADAPNPQNLDFIHDESQSVPSKVVDKGFKYDHNLDPARAIPGTSDYLDHKERREAEIQRARIEDREPDLVNPPSTQGTPLTEVSKIEAQIPYNVTVEPDVILGVSVVDEEAKAKQDKAEAKAAEKKDK